MSAVAEVISEPLTREALGERYRELCADSRFSNLPGKIEVDVWGRILMSPASNFHGMLQTRLGQRLGPLGGQAFVEASVITPAGVLVADVAWASAEFMRAHGTETPFSRAPELGIEVVSPSNSLKELREKMDAYLASGAIEAWIAFPQSRRVERFGAGGQLQTSRYEVDLDGLFD
ncbi:MAG: Uma2 family endonuclease [Burkholderiales bacterium]